MDLDRFLTRNSPSWAQLEALLAKGRGGPARLDAAELDELIRLYQLTSTHLSYASANFREPGLTGRLSRLVSQAAAYIYGTRTRTWRGFFSFFTVTLPAALYHSRRYLAASAALTFIPAVALGIWLANSPRALDAAAPPALRQAYVNHDFAAYYRSAPSAQFASHVYTNNVQVSFEAFAVGILLCVPTAVLLAYNGANIGIAAGLFYAAGQSPKFWGLVLPHGLIELTSVVIAGAAGLRLGWTAINPGDRTRRHALAEEAQRAVVLVLGTVVTLAVAGTIEGFVTGSALPTAARVGIGVTVEVAFLTYAFVLGRRAQAKGFSGLLSDGERRPSGLST